MASGVPQEWEHWYRKSKKNLTTSELERAARIERELNQMYPPASPEMLRTFDAAEKLVRESNARLRASGGWGPWHLSRMEDNR